MYYLVKQYIGVSPLDSFNDIWIYKNRKRVRSIKSIRSRKFRKHTYKWSMRDLEEALPAKILAKAETLIEIEYEASMILLQIGFEDG